MLLHFEKLKEVREIVLWVLMVLVKKVNAIIQLLWMMFLLFQKLCFYFSSSFFSKIISTILFDFNGNMCRMGSVEIL